MMITDSVENLLAAVYRLTRETPYARTKDIASSLQVSLPTVSEKIVQLAEQGYLDHRWRKGVALTTKGRLAALRVIRKHRLIETFLVEVFGFSINEVNQEACLLEHAASDRLIDAMEALLGYPKVDPHGHPIPEKDGTVDEVNYTLLADVPPGTNVVVKQVGDWDPDRLNYLKELGIVPGTRVVVRDVAPFDGPLSIDIEDRSVVLARAMAQRVGIAIIDETLQASEKSTYESTIRSMEIED